MINTLSIAYPDTLPAALHMSRLEFEREARLAMAAKQFETPAPIIPDCPN